MGGGKGQLLNSLSSQFTSQSQPSASPPAGGPPGQGTPTPGPGPAGPPGKQPFKAEVQMGQQPAVPEIIVNVISPQGKGIPAKMMMGSILTDSKKKEEGGK